MRIPVGRCLIPLAGLVLATACAGNGEYVRDYDGVVPGAHGDEAVATLVVDARTGRPLPGTTVRVIDEVSNPRFRVAPPVATFRADEYGIVSTPWHEELLNCRWIFDHRGFAATDRFASTPNVVELRPGVTVHGQLFRGREPAAGATIEHFIGCPHGAVVRTATTDAQGRYRLHDVDPRAYFLWALLPDATAEMINPQLLPVPGFVHAPIHLRPGVTAIGRVVDADGEPLAGVIVYSEQTPRGLQATTRRDGSFALLGVDPNAEVQCASGRIDGLINTPLPSWTQRTDEEETSRPGPVLVEFYHEEYGYCRAVEENGRRTLPTPGELEFPPDATAEVYDTRDGEWSEVGPKAYLLQRGAFVRLTAEGKMPRHARLESTGPWTLDWGTATLDFRGLPDGAVVIVDGHLLREPKMLGGLEPGAHTLVIGAADHTPVAMRIVLKAISTRRIEVDLPRSKR